MFRDGSCETARGTDMPGDTTPGEGDNVRVGGWVASVKKSGQIRQHSKQLRLG